MIILSLSEKGGETQQLEFDKTDVTVGRVQGNDIVLPKGNVSKKHSRIILKANAFSVEDMKSTNGTYVNGRKIAGPTPLFQGDKLYIGDFIIRVENAPAPEAANLGNEAGSLSSALHRRKDTAEAPVAAQGHVGAPSTFRRVGVGTPRCAASGNGPRSGRRRAVGNGASRTVSAGHGTPTAGRPQASALSATSGCRSHRTANRSTGCRRIIALAPATCRQRGANLES